MTTPEGAFFRLAERVDATRPNTTGCFAEASADAGRGLTQSHQVNDPQRHCLLANAVTGAKDPITTWFRPKEPSRRPSTGGEGSFRGLISTSGRAVIRQPLVIYLTDVVISVLYFDVKLAVSQYPVHLNLARLGALPRELVQLASLFPM